MSIKIEDLVKYGNIGYYQFFKATMLVLLIDEKPINYFTCFEFSQNYKHEQKFKYLTKSPCTIRKGIQLCIGEIIISIDKFNLIWNDYITKKEYSIENNSVILDSTFETDARFVPAIDPTTGQYNMFIPIEKHLFGSDFIGNYYLFELFSENKQLSILSNKDIDKIQIEIQKIALIYKLNILTDHIGSLVCKFPIEIVKHHPILLNRQQGIRINFDKDQRVGEERRFLLTFMQEFDQCICYNKTVENFDFKEIVIYPNQHINKITIIDSQSELIVYALYLDYTLKVGYDRDIQPPWVVANGYFQTRKINLNGKLQEIGLNFVARAGEVCEFIDTGRTNKRIEKEKQRFFYDYHILRSYAVNEHKRAIIDIREIINMPQLLWDLQEICIIDPYLMPADLIETVFFSKVKNITIKALCSYHAIHNNKNMRGSTSDIKGFKTRIENELNDALCNETDLQLDYRTICDGHGEPFHDRYLILKYGINGCRAYSLGSSINSIGKQHTIIQAVLAPEIIAVIFDNLWNKTDFHECKLYAI